jgi:hypothetical protein
VPLFVWGASELKFQYATKSARVLPQFAAKNNAIAVAVILTEAPQYESNTVACVQNSTPLGRESVEKRSRPPLPPSAPPLSTSL